MRVLIIEDDPDQSEALCKLLDRRRLEPTCAESLEEGLACMSTGNFQCVVLDLGLPDSSPRETAQRIPEFQPVPVVALTGSDDRELIRLCRLHGAGYALKGTDALSIMEKVLLAIERFTPSRHVEEEIISTQRERKRDKEEKAQNDKPWFLQWAPLMSFTVALLVASATAGSVLYKGITEDAAKEERTRHRFEQMEKGLSTFQANMESMARQQQELAMKTQQSVDDRAGLHREMGGIRANQQELKNEVIRRLERIEDQQTTLLKELAKPHNR